MTVALEGRRSIGSLWAALFFAVLISIAMKTPALASGTGEGSADAAFFPESTVVLSRPSQDSGVELSFGYGYQDVAGSGEYLPIEIGIRNKTEAEIAGKLEAIIENGSGTEAIYGYDINISGNSSDTVRSTINVPEDVSELGIRLIKEDGTVLAERSEVLRIHGNGAELLVGILSNDPDSLSYFRGVSPGDSGLSTRTVILNPSSMPDTKEGYEQLDAIIISDFNMSRLSEEAVSAIYEWVRDGGALLIGMGVTSDPLGGFGELLEDLEMSAPEYQEVNMGLQYSTEGPDGAMLELMVRDVYLPYGIQVMQSGGLAVLTNVSVGSGVIGLAAYSLCDISDFCYEQLGYVEELLGNLFGSARLRQLESLMGEGGTELQKVKKLVDVADGDRLPDMGIYLWIALIYVILCGPVLYAYLRYKGLAVYYPFGMTVGAFGAALIIWICSLGIRFDSDYADYAAIRYMSEGQNQESVFLKLSSPDREVISFTAPEGSSILPLLPEREEAGGMSRSSSVIRIDGLTEDRSASDISISSESAFSEAYFELIRDIDVGEEGELELSLGYFEDELSGEIVNSTSHRLSDVSLLLFGRIISVGDLEPGESRDLSGLETIYGPTGSAKLTSEYVTGIELLDRDDREYGRKLKETNMLAYYLEETVGYYYQNVRLVAFIEDDPEEELFSGIGMESSGVTLLISSFDADYSSGNRIYRSALSEEPRVVSGNYDTASNTISGGTSAVLEYSFGTDVRVQSVRFNSLSEEFRGRTDEEGRRLTEFSGAMSMYNYQTGGYDLIDSGKTEFSEEEIAPYMSPENAVMVRYLPDENAEDGSVMFLPVPMITGVS